MIVTFGWVVAAVAFATGGRLRTEPEPNPAADPRAIVHCDQ